MEGLRVRRDNSGVLRLTLTRPQVRNALDVATQRALSEALEGVANDESVRVVALSAEGDHFCSGADIGEAAGRPKPARVGHIQRGLGVGVHRVISAVWNSQVPVVVAVQGHAAGMGCNLAVACDYVVAARSAKFSTPFVRHGFAADTGAAYLLPRLVGVARAREMLLLGREVDAATAASWGLINEVVDDALVASRLDEVALAFGSAATVAVGLTKVLLHRSLDEDFPAALAGEGPIQELAVRSDDFKEGMTAFLERRNPRYRGV